MRRILRLALLFISASYLLGLVVYLALRFSIGDRFRLLALVNSFTPVIFLPLLLLLPLVLLLRRRVLIIPALILSLIGVVWFAPYYLPKAYAAPSGPTLRIVTFNVSETNQRLQDVETWLRQIKPDIVFLQEYPANEVQERPALLKDVFPYQFIQTRDWRNVILSRHPFLTMDNVGVQPGVWPTQQRITIDVDGQTVVLYNIHLINPLRDPRRQNQTYSWQNVLHYNQYLRDYEVKALITRLQSETAPLIVAGDFNMSDQAAIYNDLAARLKDSFREAGTGYGASWPVITNGGLLKLIPPVLRIDYIWHNTHLRAVSVEQGPVLGSDHLPLLATLELLK